MVTLFSVLFSQAWCVAKKGEDENDVLASKQGALSPVAEDMECPDF
jgi:hypothetical protein